MVITCNRKSRMYTTSIIKIIVTDWIKKHQSALTHKLSQVINSLYIYGNIYCHVQGAAPTHLSLNIPYKRN
jgi:hypothetical protein